VIERQQDNRLDSAARRLSRRQFLRVSGAAGLALVATRALPGAALAQGPAAHTVA
jgi:hypothetical protein